MMCEKLLRLPAVMKRTGLKKAAIYAGIAAGTFPPPVKIGIRAVAWPESWIDAWIAKLIAKTRTERSDTANAG